MQTKNDNATKMTFDEFFVWLRNDQRDIMPHPISPDYTIWTTRDGVEVARAFPGWKYPGVPQMFVLA
jgi:hypothetical protein